MTLSVYMYKSYQILATEYQSSNLLKKMFNIEQMKTRISHMPHMRLRTQSDVNHAHLSGQIQTHHLGNCFIKWIGSDLIN
jgi:hypothetical protein